jgi:hypothetical protein
MLQSPTDVTKPLVQSITYSLPFEASVQVRVTTGGDMPAGISNRKVTVSIAASVAARFGTAKPILSPIRSLGKSVVGSYSGTTRDFTTDSEGLLTLFIYWDTSKSNSIPQSNVAPSITLPLH